MSVKMLAIKLEFKESEYFHCGDKTYNCSTEVENGDIYVD